jgi:hypothetical protein
MAEDSESRVMRLKDSGAREEFSTGAVRDTAAGKGRFDLLAFSGIVDFAQQLELGANKYAARNWEKGMPISRFAGSGLRHTVKAIMGFDDEPHLKAALWNLNCWSEGLQRIKSGLWVPELDDMPYTYKGKEPWF